MTRDDARNLWAETGLKFSDLNKLDLQKLRTLVNEGLINHSHLNGYRCRQRWTVREKFAELRCSSFYFGNRECITFNEDGFIGFAGWADDKNIQPILQGFKSWIEYLQSQKIARPNASREILTRDEYRSIFIAYLVEKKNYHPINAENEANYALEEFARTETENWGDPAYVWDADAAREHACIWVAE